MMVILVLKKIIINKTKLVALVLLPSWTRMKLYRHILVYISFILIIFCKEVGKIMNLIFCRDIFADYADFCFKTFGDRVKNWFTMNEPRIVALLGYDTGTNPPNHCTKCAAGGNSATEPYKAVHNIILSHATAVARYRSKYQVF
jgi:hypothetical protein